MSKTVCMTDVEAIPVGTNRWIAKGAVTHDGSAVVANFDWFTLSAATPDEAFDTATRMMTDAVVASLRMVWC